MTFDPDSPALPLQRNGLAGFLLVLGNKYDLKKKQLWLGGNAARLRLGFYHYQDFSGQA